MIDDTDIAVPVAEWRPKQDQLVMIFVEHPHARNAPFDERHLWRGWYFGSWTRHDGGRWIWHGIQGEVTHVRPLPPVPRAIATGRAA